MPFFKGPAESAIAIEPGVFAGHFTQPMMTLFSQVATNPLPATLCGPERLLPLAEQIYGGALAGYDSSHYPPRNSIQEPAVPIDDKKIIIGYSGGKDSLAVLLWALREEMKPIMFHVTGLNRSYPGELAAVQAISDRLGVPAVYPNIKLIGRHDYPDNPCKDQLILAMMADYGLRIGCRNFTQGVECTNTLKKSNIKYNYSDAVELFDAFNIEYVRPQWPDYRWRWVIETHTHSYWLVKALAPNLLELTNSCVMTHRFQGMRRKQTQERVGLNLRANTCGTCWKCAVDYLNLYAMDWFYHEWNQPMVVRCLEIFKLKINEAYGNGYMERATYAELLPVAVDPKYGAGKRYDKLMEVACGMEA